VCSIVAVSGYSKNGHSVPTRLGGADEKALTPNSTAYYSSLRVNNWAFSSGSVLFRPYYVPSMPLFCLSPVWRVLSCQFSVLRT
jgi:hypothetical protein